VLLNAQQLLLREIALKIPGTMYNIS
jgi:hypothetical protein